MQTKSTPRVVHVECGSCGESYDCEVRPGWIAAVKCGTCGCDDPRLVTIREVRAQEAR